MHITYINVKTLLLLNYRQESCYMHLECIVIHVSAKFSEGHGSSGFIADYTS